MDTLTEHEEFADHKV